MLDLSTHNLFRRPFGKAFRVNYPVVKALCRRTNQKVSALTTHRSSGTTRGYRVLISSEVRGSHSEYLNSKMYLVLYEWAPTGGYEASFDWSGDQQAPPPATETPHQSSYVSLSPAVVRETSSQLRSFLLSQTATDDFIQWIRYVSNKTVFLISDNLSIIAFVRTGKSKRVQSAPPSGRGGKYRPEPSVAEVVRVGDRAAVAPPHTHRCAVDPLTLTPTCLGALRFVL